MRSFRGQDNRKVALVRSDMRSPTACILYLVILGGLGVLARLWLLG